MLSLTGGGLCECAGGMVACWDALVDGFFKYSRHLQAALAILVSILWVVWALQFTADYSSYFAMTNAKVLESTLQAIVSCGPAFCYRIDTVFTDSFKNCTLDEVYQREVYFPKGAVLTVFTKNGGCYRDRDFHRPLFIAAVILSLALIAWAGKDLFAWCQQRKRAHRENLRRVQV